METGRSVGSLGTGITVFSIFLWVLGTKFRSLEEQPVLLTNELSLQPPTYIKEGSGFGGIHLEPEAGVALDPRPA